MEILDRNLCEGERMNQEDMPIANCCFSCEHILCIQNSEYDEPHWRCDLSEDEVETWNICEEFERCSEYAI